MASKYGQKSQDKVESAMRRRKKGTLKSGSGKKVTSRKQAIAIGLSEARSEGGKVPSRTSSSKKSPSKKSSSKKRSSGSSKKSSSARKSTSKKSASRKSSSRKSSGNRKSGSKKK